MPATKRSTRGRTQDRGRVAVGQKYEVAYMARKTGSTVDEVKSAIRKAGSNMRKAVKSALGGGNTSARKATGKKSAAKKSAGKKSGGKTTARKAGAKKSGAKKSTVRKSSAKGAAGRKSGARKTGAKSRAGSAAKRGAKKAA